MQEMKLGPIESHFAEIIWKNEPLSSGELVKLCEKELSWKKPTTYTVLRKLCERGIFQNQDSTVTSLISRGDFYAMQSEQSISMENITELTSDFIQFEGDPELAEELVGILHGIKKEDIEVYPESFGYEPLKDCTIWLERDEMILKTYYQMSDGTWATDDHTYKYMYSRTGKMGDYYATFKVLSNSEENITFNDILLASGLGSHTDSYFDPAESVIVFEQITPELP